jgi:DNA (cytosine-5)-methyltransferase 1
MLAPAPAPARRAAAFHRGKRSFVYDGWVDLFCGAGGATTGLTLAGHSVRLAANHWQTAIDTHSANHPETDHACVDINHYDMRKLPRTRFLWASVICTEASPAGGRKRTRGQLTLEIDGEPVNSAAFERTRACALDVIRATEVHRYDVVVVENVVEFSTDWELFDWWRKGMAILGYQSHVYSMSAAHVGGDDNEPAAQWRDRIIILFVRDGLPMIDLTPNPLAWCGHCGRDIEATQAWKNGNTIGKYRQQYLYVHARPEGCGKPVEPYVLPAASVIDFANPGPKIGERGTPAAPRTKRLVQATRAKIDLALREYAYLCEPLLVTTTHGKEGDPRAVPARLSPLPTRTVKTGDGFVVPPGAFIVEQRGGGSLYRPVTHPISTLGTSRNHGLVIPYRKGRGKSTAEPLLTLATHDSAAVILEPTIDIDECTYRMIQPREAMSAQRFATTYVVHGTKGEQTAQAGNAVPVNLSQWIGKRVREVLDGAAA